MLMFFIVFLLYLHPLRNFTNPNDLCVRIWMAISLPVCLLFILSLSLFLSTPFRPIFLRSSWRLLFLLSKWTKNALFERTLFPHKSRFKVKQENSFMMMLWNISYTLVTITIHFIITTAASPLSAHRMTISFCFMFSSLNGLFRRCSTWSTLAADGAVCMQMHARTTLSFLSLSLSMILAFDQGHHFNDQFFVFDVSITAHTHAFGSSLFLLQICNPTLSLVCF